MAIRSVVLRGYGNGTFAGTIPLVVTRGYIVGAAADIPELICVHDVMARLPSIGSVAANIPSSIVAARIPSITDVSQKC